MAERKVPASLFASLEDARKSLREESLLALERQLGVVEWLRAAHSRDVLSRFAEHYGGTKVDDPSPAQKTSFERVGGFLHQDLLGLIPEAPTYFVSRDMTEMIRMAAEDMPREGITPVDLLTGTGFLYFHHPIEIIGPADDPGTVHPDVDPNEQPITKTEPVGIRAIAWKHSDWVSRPDGSRSPGVSYFLFTDVDQNLFAKTELAADGVTFAEFRREYGDLSLYDFSGWTYGLDWGVVPYEDAPQPLADPPLVHPVVDQVRLILATTWKMLSQKIVQVEQQRPPRHLRRRASRIIPGDGDVTVIRLRREYHPEGGEDQAAMNAQAPEGEGPWFSHRFLVRGHWKRQFYGEGRAERKLIWVAPYVRGPEDKPLIIKKRIYSLEQ